MHNISVIIPTYNRCDCLVRALRSVFCQTLLPDQVIVIDDGSEDETRVLIARYFPQVIYHYQSNQGVSAARNKGLQLASHEWIAFLDSDDEWLPDKLQVQLEALKQDPANRVCHTEEVWVRRGKRVNQMAKHQKRGGRIFTHCLPICAMSPSSIMIHRSVFEQTGEFDEQLPACEDYDLWLRITARYPVLFIEKAQIIKYGGHEDQLSMRYWGMDRFRIYALEKILNSGILQASDRAAAIVMLQKKCSIYREGALKRKKFSEAETYQQIAKRYMEA
jgi:glycosyltransferase involved in cell wall biosynthesis